MNEKAQKNAYWRKRTNDKLVSAFKALLADLKEVKKCSEYTDIDQEKLKKGFLFISHGMELTQRVILGIEVKKGGEDGKSTGESTPAKK